MPGVPQRYDFDRVFRLLLTLGALVGTVWLLAYLSDVLVPFAVALLLAYLLNPIVNAFESKTRRRGVAVALTLAIFGTFIAVLLPLMITLICREAADISQVLVRQDIKTRIVEAAGPWIDKLGWDDLRARLQEFRESTDPQQMQKLSSTVLGLIVPRLPGLAAGVVGFLGSVLHAVLALTVVLIVLLYLVFLLMDFRRFQAGWKEQLPPHYRDAIVEFFDEFSSAMHRYFRSQLLVAACSGVLFAVGFWLIGLRMAIMLGLLLGLLNMVPYLQVVGFIPAILLGLLKAFETGSSALGSMALVVLVFGIVQLVQETLLVPRIMGRSTGLKPWVIMLSIFVWGKLLGFLGLVLAIPLSCLGLAYYRRNILKTKSGNPQRG